MSYKSRSNWNIGTNVTQEQWNKWFPKTTKDNKHKDKENVNDVSKMVQTTRSRSS